MASLKSNQKIFVVQHLAMFRTPSEIVEMVEHVFKVKVSISQVSYYDPKYGKISEPLKKIYAETRERFLNEIAEIPIANEAYRIQVLQNSLDRQLKSRVVNEAMVLDILEQAAKERGRMFTNRREITGAGGKALFSDPLSIAKAVMDELVKDGMDSSEAMQFVAGRYKVAQTDLISEANN